MTVKGKGAPAPPPEPDEDQQFAAGFLDPEHDPPPAGDDPPKVEGDPPPAGDDPPKVEGDPPPAGDDPPKVEGDPPPTGDDPPKVEGDPPPTGDDPPKVEGDPPKVSDVRQVLDHVNARFDDLERKGAKPPEVAAKPKPAAPPKVDLSALKGDKLKARMKKIRESDPETADAFEDIIGGVVGAVDAQQQQLEGDRVTREATRAQTDASSRISQVEAKHPGWQVTAKSPAFEAWFGNQPQYLQRIAKETDDPGEMIEIMDKFAEDTKPPAADGGTPPDDDAAARAAAAAERKALIEPTPKGKPSRQDPKGAIGDSEAYFNGWTAADKELEAMRA